MSNLNKYTTAPLAVEEERELVKRWRDHRDVKARDRVIMSNLRFAIRVIRSANRLAEQDDLEQEAVVAMLKALETFDPDRGFRFITYAESKILSGIQTADIAARNIRLPPRAFAAVVGVKSGISDKSAEAACVAAAEMVRLDEPGRDTNMGSGRRFSESGRSSGAPYHDRVGIEQAEDERAEETEAIANEVMIRTTPLEKLLLTRFYFDDKNGAEIGREIGMNRNRVHRLRNAAFERLRERRKARVPLATEEWWSDEAYDLRRAFEGRAVKFTALRAWAGQRYAMFARRYLLHLLAWMVLEGRAEWFGDTVRFGGRRAESNNVKRPRKLAV